MTRIGAWLKELRQRKGVSQSQLSDEIATRYGIHLEPSRYSQMERGKEGPPTLKCFLAMIDYFNADVATLFDGGENAQITGLEFLFHNAALAGEILQMRDSWGEEATARFLLSVVRSANDMHDSEQPPRKSRLRAARPGSGPARRK